MLGDGGRLAVAPPVGERPLLQANKNDCLALDSWFTEPLIFLDSRCPCVCSLSDMRSLLIGSRPTTRTIEQKSISQ